MEALMKDPQKFMEAMQKIMQALEPIACILELLPPMKVLKELEVTTTDDKGKKTKKTYIAILIEPKEENPKNVNKPMP